MKHTRSTTRVTADSSERDLLAACREGSLEAVELLIDRHASAGVNLALRIAARARPDVDLLNLVHDAFVTAFDEALESDADSLAVVFHGLIRLFVDRPALRDDPSTGERTFPPHGMQDLRTDLIRELGVMIAVHAETPHARTLVQRLLGDLRALRRRLRFRIGAPRSPPPIIVSRHGEPT